MKKAIISLGILILLIVMASFPATSQTNMTMTNPVADQVLRGNYNPLDYKAINTINAPADIINGINSNISTDSLHSYLLKMSSFQTRHTASDTLSSTRGIGAARNWALQHFDKFSTANEDRLVTSFFQFDEDVCGITRHKNTLAILPGMDTTNHSVIILEAHYDSRCNLTCDTSCLAEGMEDNGSGSALVMELARVMSKYTFSNTIVFMLNIGEEQGLVGAEAFSLFADNENINIEAVLNNDVIGGVICGKTSSPPSCPGLNHIDSTQVRLFSFGLAFSDHKNLARYIHLQYKEELLHRVKVPMQVTIMSPEDRTGRGGDHIPFRQMGFTSIRFTSANEHGSANSSDTSYHDRQHTSNDVLGVDTDGDLIIDSFFVDFNYLARNAVINGTNAALIAYTIFPPTFDVTYIGGNRLVIDITSQTHYGKYRVGVRSTNNYFDSVYTINGATDTVEVSPSSNYWVSVASVDSNGIESLFAPEQRELPTGMNRPTSKNSNLELLQNTPNPFEGSTIVTVLVGNEIHFDEASINITDLTGKLIMSYPISLNKGVNDILYEHGYNQTGTFIYYLIVDGTIISSKKMVFTN